MKTSKILPYLALVSGILALTFSSLFIRWADAPGIVTAFYRMALASIAFLPFVLRSINKNPENRSGLLRWLPIILLGGLFTALDHATWAVALGMTKVANATFFNNIAPLWVALFALIFLKERQKLIFWLGLFLTLAGAGVIFGYDLIYNPHLSRGDLLGILSSFFYCGYFLVTQMGRKHLNTLIYVWGVTTVAAVVLLVANLVAQNPFTGYSTNTYLSFFGAALISQVIGYLSVGYALGHLPASIVSPTMIAQPMLTAVIAVPLAGEPLHISVILGGVLVLGGIYLVNQREAKTPTPPPDDDYQRATCSSAQPN